MTQFKVASIFSNHMVLQRDKNIRIFGQGEADDMKPVLYQKLLTRMIRQWRDDWEDQTLPFLFVQLPMHRNESDPDYKNWCLLRESQMNTFQT